MERVAVIGLGQFGNRIALRMAELGAEVLAIDSDPTVIEMSRSKVSQAIQLDATDEGAFQSSGVDEVDTVIVAIGRNIEVSILVVAQLVRMAVPHIIARACSDLHAQILRLIGAHEITNPEEEMGDSLALRLIAPEIHDRVLLPTGHEWVELDAPAHFWGKTVEDLAFKERYGVILVAIHRREAVVSRDGRNEFKSELVESKPKDVVREGDRLAFIGSPDNIRELVK